MNLTINIGPGVPNMLEKKLRRQLSYKLAAFEPSVKGLVATLSLEENRLHKTTWYLCQMRASLIGGGQYSFELRSAHPNICIADAASRLARQISRKTRSLDPLVAAG